jgi:hypothetical protein
MEGRRRIVSIGENHGRAPHDIGGFMGFVQSFRAPTIHRAIRNAKRIGEIVRYNLPCSVRRAFDKLDRFPHGLIPIGDSVCRFTPIFGQGMSVAAQASWRDCSTPGAGVAIHSTAWPIPYSRKSSRSWKRPGPMR